jgi:hypothetical protein
LRRNAIDKAQAAKRNVKPGGRIEIHGWEDVLGSLGPLEREGDWTDGRLVLKASEADEIYAAVPIGTSEEIRP